MLACWLCFEPAAVIEADCRGAATARITPSLAGLALTYSGWRSMSTPQSKSEATCSDCTSSPQAGKSTEATTAKRLDTTPSTRLRFRLGSRR